MEETVLNSISASCRSVAPLSFLTKVLHVFSWYLFRKRFVLFDLILLRADFWFAILLTPTGATRVTRI